MGTTDTHHSTLVSGLLALSGRKVGNQIQPISSGTLTGVATRNSDGKKVLATCLHIVSTKGWAAGISTTTLGPVTGR